MSFQATFLFRVWPKLRKEEAQQSALVEWRKRSLLYRLQPAGDGVLLLKDDSLGMDILIWEISVYNNFL